MKLLLITLLLLFASTAHAERLHHEAVYQESWCAQKGGVTEYVLQDKARVDCLTDDHAIEFDFADKWAKPLLRQHDRKGPGDRSYYGR